MNEQRAFTVIFEDVKNCSECPYGDHDHEFCNASSSHAAYALNQKTITPSCPMWKEAKPIGELK